MSRLLLSTTCVLVSLAVSRPAVAVTVYSTGFEAPVFAAGSVLNGQDGWTVPFAFLSPNAAVISTSNPATGSQDVQIRGADMVHADQVGGGGLDAVGSYRHTVNYDTAASGLKLVTVAADERLDGPKSSMPDFFSANLGAIAAGDAGVEISLSSDGFIYTYDNNTGNRIGSPYPFQFGTYYHLATVVDFNADTYHSYVIGALVATTTFDPSTSTTVLGRGSLVTYAYPDSALDMRAAYTAHYDNFSITAGVPEPSSLLLAALGCLGLAAWRRR